ncbi:hypothetical protein [Thioalkalivibrio sp. HK1]|uniref:hypothetical protein n=1 Tax=Thioalkalivibrio sp. HK1 TaxID=1469245 RepID=UPI0004728E1D|nr:hypothetical protein [Thioalkalivibrio sp. HK1]
MSEEKRIDRLEGLYIENKVSIETHERMISEMKANTEKVLSEISALRGDFSDLRNEFFKLEVRVTWRIIAFSSLGGAVAGLLMILFGVGAK